MKKWIKKAARISIPEKWLAIFAVILLIVMLLPLIRLAFYAMPWYDDYGYATYVKSFIKQDGPFKGALAGALYVVKTWWWCWQGTFSSIFMMSLMPEAFGEGLYPLGVIGVLLFFTMSSLVFVKAIFANVLKPRRNRINTWLIGTEKTGFI